MNTWKLQLNRRRSITWFILLAGCIWAALTLVVLIFGLRASHVPSASGEVAMQMFVLSFPSSIGVAQILNALNGWPNVQSSYGIVFYAWVPFFVAGCFQFACAFALATRMHRRT